MRVTVLSLVPDAGHIISSLRIASVLRSLAQVSVDVVAPDEAQHLLERLPDGFSPHLLGSVMPARYREILDEWATAPTEWQQARVDARMEREYFVPTSYSGWSKLPLIRELLASRPANLLIADDLLFTGAYASVAQESNTPIIIHRACGSLFPVRRGRNVPPELTSSPRSTALLTLARMEARLRGKIGATLSNPSEMKHRAQLSALQHHWKSSQASLSASETMIARLCTGFGAIERAMFPEHRVIPDSAIHLGPLPSFEWKPVACEALQWVRADPRPVVLVSYGSMTSRGRFPLSLLLESAKARGFRCLLLSKGEAQIGDAIMGNDYLQVPWADQALLLRESNVRLMVTHAGSGALQEALWSLVPTLCIPTGWDQPYNSWLAEKMGIGVWMKRGNEAQAVQDAFSSLKNMRKRMEQVRDLALELKGSERLVEIVKKSLGANQ